MKRLVLLAVLIFTGSALAHDEDQKGGVAPEKLGKVTFPTSCDPAVQPMFERGVALLHSFWFPEGLKTFNEVLKRDPSCAIAYWAIGVNRLLNPSSPAPSPPPPGPVAQSPPPSGRRTG